MIRKLAAILECDPSELTYGDERYAQKPSARVSPNAISSEEFELILHYRKLPEPVRSLIKEVCFSHIIITSD